MAIDGTRPGNDGYRKPNRRTFLRAASGVTVTGLVAGCTGDPGDGGGGNTPAGGGQEAPSGGDGTSDGGGDLDFPTEQITFIVPYGPGGGFDFYTRTLANVLQEENIVPVPVLVRNVEGSSGIVATNQVYNAEPDGYTAMICNTESFAIAQIARPDAVRYDISKMTALPRVAGTLRAVGVSTQTDIKTGEEFMKAAKEGKLNFGNQGAAATNAIQMKALAALGGDEVFSLETYLENSVTFGGRGGEYTALKRGDVQVMTGSYSSLNKFVEAGDLRYVLVYSQEDAPPEGTKNEGCDTFETLKITVENVEKIVAISGGPFHRMFAGPPGIPEARHSYLCEMITEAIKSDAYQQAAAEVERPVKYGDCQLANEGFDQTLTTYQENKDLLKEFGLL